MKKPVRVTVTGAAGQIGYSLLFRIASGAMLAFALVGLVANVVSLLLLRDAQKESLNMRGAYLEVMGDLAGSVAVIAAAHVGDLAAVRAPGRT
mgnify:CR=1 FL=1